MSGLEWQLRVRVVHPHLLHTYEVDVNRNLIIISNAMTLLCSI